MAQKPWTPDEEQYLRDHYRKVSHAEIGDALGRSACAIKTRAQVIGLTTRRRWNADSLAILKKKYADTRTQTLADLLERPICSVYNKAFALGLKKSEAFLKSEESGWLTKFNCHVGEKNRFPKGHVPANKGKKMPFNANSAATQFKKGNRPQTYQPVGTEVVLEDGYIKVKIADPNVWDLKHRLVWKNHQGEIPDGGVIRFKDGNKSNCERENLFLIDQAENMLRNSRHNYPAEVIPVVHALSELRKEIKNAEK